MVYFMVLSAPYTIHSSTALNRLLGPGLFFSFVIFFTQTVGLLWTGDQPVARPLPTHKTTKKYRINVHTISIPWVEFEPTIPASERAKTVHTLDRAVTVIGSLGSTVSNDRRIGKLWYDLDEVGRGTIPAYASRELKFTQNLSQDSLYLQGKLRPPDRL
jgi:hypothetical protein